MLATIDRTRLAAFYGTKADADEPDTARLQRDFDAQKQALVDALARKAGALAEQPARRDEFATAWKELRRWLDVDDAASRFPLLYLRYLRASGQLGQALKHIGKTLPAATDLEVRACMCAGV